MMACPKAMVTKTAFTKTLAQVKGVKIREQELDPFDSHGQLAIRLEAAYMKRVTGRRFERWWPSPMVTLRYRAPRKVVVL